MHSKVQHADSHIVDCNAGHGEVRKSAQTAMLRGRARSLERDMQSSGYFSPEPYACMVYAQIFFLEGGFMLSAVLRVSVRMTSSHQVLSSLHVHKLRP